MQCSDFNMSEQSMLVTQLDLEGRKAAQSLSPVITLLSSGQSLLFDGNVKHLVGCSHTKERKILLL